MRLLIAEKPSVAQEIAAVVGADKRHSGYLEGNGWLVSWCYARLKADAGRKGDRIIYRVVDEMLYLQLRQSELPMAAFPKDAAYNVAFMESKLKRYEQILREASMQQEQQRRSELHNGGREN